MKPLNFFAYWNNYFMRHPFEKTIFFFLFFYTIIAPIVFVFFLFYLAYVLAPVFIVYLIVTIGNIIILIFYGYTLWYLFIKEYYLYRKNFKK